MTYGDLKDSKACKFYLLNGFTKKAFCMYDVYTVLFYCVFHKRVPA